MAQVLLQIGGRRYDLACRDGEQARLEALAAVVDAKAQQAAQAVGGVNEARQLMLAALLLADELEEARAGRPVTSDPDLAAALEAIADRIEMLAARLEKGGGEA
jgi:cell division protein ZapA